MKHGQVKVSRACRKLPGASDAISERALVALASWTRIVEIDEMPPIRAKASAMIAYLIKVLFLSFPVFLYFLGCNGFNMSPVELEKTQVWLEQEGDLHTTAKTLNIC